MTVLSRRRFLLGSGVAMLGACSSPSTKLTSSAQTGAPSGTKDATDITASKGSYELAQSFASGSIVAGIPQRLTFSLVNAADGSGVSQGPASFSGMLTREGQNFGTPFEMKRRSKDLIRPYWALPTTFDKAGSWVFTARFPDGTTASKAFSVITKSDNTMPTIGDKLIGIDTPTTSNKHGVDPICTRQPSCPLHAISLKDAIAAKKPTAFFIGTPAYCQTGICGPVLEILLAQQKVYPNIQMIHAEVYAAPYYGADTATSPAVQAYALVFEPYIVIADADGVIQRRLDVIWDAEELRSALSAVA